MNILIADSFPENQLENLQFRGYQCSYQPSLDGESLAESIRGHDVLVVRSTRVTSSVFANADQLKLVIRAGAGTNTIDKDDARKRDINVCNVPGKNAIAVAELAMGLVIAIDRFIPDNVIDLRNGQWNKKTYAKARGLYGQTLGIVGLGAIGLALAERARVFGIRCLAVNKSGRSADVLERIEALEIVLVNTQRELLEQSDIVSLHLPANENTRHTVNADFLECMQTGSCLINTSRAEVVDEDALIKAMDTRSIRVGLDVFNDEPAGGQSTIDSQLAQHPSVYGTHHIGASTKQAQQAVAEGVVEIIETFSNGEIRHCVNM